MIIHSYVFDFLSELEKNNNREWFKANRLLYDKALLNIQEFTNELIARIALFDYSLANETAKTSLFRIYRDVRFSPNKNPYKLHFGIYMVKGGKSSPFAGYYLHIQNNASEVVGGIWSPEKDILSKVREEIYYEPETFLSVLNNPEFSKTFKDLLEIDVLKKTPKPYPSDFQYVDLLKHKHYCIGKSFTNQEILDKDFINKCTGTFKLMFPFNEYLNTIIQL